MGEDKRLYDDQLAERLKTYAHTAYQPSNGTEGMMFEERWCNQCTRGETCAIWDKAHWCDPKDLDYPGELQYGADGQPCCTAFVEAAEPEAPR